MTAPELVPLAYLYAGSGAIEGATRFQKLVFLGQEEGGIEKKFDYDSDKYGPFSVDLVKTINGLIEQDLVEKKVVENRGGEELHRFILTNKGRQVMHKIITEDRFPDIADLMEEVKDMKKEYDSLSLDELLRYVYRNYPEYTKDTELQEFVP